MCRCDPVFAAFHQFAEMLSLLSSAKGALYEAKRYSQELLRTADEGSTYTVWALESFARHITDPDRWAVSNAAFLHSRIERDR